MMGLMVSLSELPWPLRTERLELSPLTEADLPEVFAFRGLPSVQEWLGSAQPTLKTFAEHAVRTVEKGSRLTVRHQGRVIGDLMVLVGDAWSQREVAEGVRDSLHRTRGWLDGYRYALLAEEWRAPH